MRATSLGVKDFDLGGIPHSFRVSTSFSFLRIQKDRSLRAPLLVYVCGK